MAEKEPKTDMTRNRASSACKCHGDCRGPDSLELRRRQFLQIGLGAAAAATAGLPVMAGPFENDNEYLRLIPLDKRLDAKWLASLAVRGQKECYRDPKALQHIGMPVGGLFAGTVYLSGDGRLWLWDIFNGDPDGILPRATDRWPPTMREWSPEEFNRFTKSHPNRGGLNYVDPASPTSPFEQGFSLRIGEQLRSLDSKGFAEVAFEGRYPIGRVSYRDPQSPVEVTLEAFSPFIPLSVDDSSLPATVLSYTLRNTSAKPVIAELIGRIENPICLDSRLQMTGQRRNRVVREPGLAAIVCSAEPASTDAKSQRPDILFEDFEKATYEGWTVTGDAFGNGPAEIAKLPKYQGDVGGEGQQLVNSNASAPGNDARQRDLAAGTLTSKPFVIQRRFIRLLVGGGDREGATCVNVVIDGKAVASVAGRNSNRMQPATLNVARYEGREARLEIVDQIRGPWGNIGVDQIVFTDRSAASGTLDQQHDFGTMALARLGGTADDRTAASRDAKDANQDVHGTLDASLVGELGRTLRLKPGEQATVNFIVTWHFPNFFARGVGGARVGNYYATRFDSAFAVARYLAKDFDRLAGTTRRWVETWYDSSLPCWLLDRTMANTSTLATTTCYRFADGRFWAWEGVGCCPGTCTHVWHYAQAPGRLFPEIERITRERVDFGIAQKQDGGIGMRAALTDANLAAHDGHCGRILGVLREHQMSTDDQFLRRLWPRVKKAVQFMIARDGNADGLIEGGQPNTLDATWYGKISWLSSLYLAALRAGEAMAREVGDDDFARECRQIVDRGGQGILQLFNGQYFTQAEDPAHPKTIGTGVGCHIDQVFGQTWAHWVGLGRLFDRDKQLSALRSLWKYNFVPNVGPFREHFKYGRWYALAGDAGLLMCTWPKGGKNPAYADHWTSRYFNECMSGFEWQVAAHMIWEGHDQPDLLQDGLAVARAIHDRYNAAIRNPYNEIECSDHYSRAMASYGVFQAVCGFNCHGPKCHIEFAPRLTPEDFKAAFTAAGAWGSLTQRREGNRQTATLTPRCGQLRLRTIGLKPLDGIAATSVRVSLGDRILDAKVTIQDAQAIVTLAEPVLIDCDQTLTVTLG